MEREDSTELLEHISKKMSALGVDPNSQLFTQHDQTQDEFVINQALQAFGALVDPSTGLLHESAGNHALYLLPTVQCVRKLLSRLESPPIEYCCTSGFTKAVVNLLITLVSHWKAQAVPEGSTVPPVPQIGSFGNLLFETEWAITNIASGSREQTAFVLSCDSRTIFAFVALMEFPQSDCVEQAVWALGNIAGDGSDLRDMVLAAGTAAALTSILRDVSGAGSKLSIRRNVVWCLSNLARSKPPPDFQYFIEPCSLALVTVLQLMNEPEMIEDHEVFLDASWFLSYLGENGVNNILHTIMELMDIYGPQVFQNMMAHSIRSTAHATPALRFVGNFLTGDDQVTQAVLDKGVLPWFYAILASTTKANIRKEVFWSLSNVAASGKDKVLMLINANFFPLLASAIANEEEKVMKEAVWTVANCSVTCPCEQSAIYMINTTLGSLLQVLKKCLDTKIIPVAFEAIENLMCAGDAAKKAVLEFNGLVEVIETLQSHPSINIYEAAVRILEQLEDGDGSS